MIEFTLSLLATILGIVVTLLLILTLLAVCLMVFTVSVALFYAIKDIKAKKRQR